MKRSELIKILKKFGCRLIREGTEHEMWYSEINGNNFPVWRQRGRDKMIYEYPAIISYSKEEQGEAMPQSSDLNSIKLGNGEIVALVKTNTASFSQIAV